MTGARQAKQEKAVHRREVKKIVITYDLKSLPPTLIRSSMLLRSKLARQRLRIEVLLRPLSQLPPDTDVLFVPAELLEEAQAAAQGGAHRLARIGLLDANKTYQAVFDELIKELQSGEEVFARSVDEAGGLEQPGERGGVIVRYRGNERLR